MPTSITTAPSFTYSWVINRVVLFALPICIGNILQQLYNTVDTLVIGNFCGTQSLAAVGTSGQPRLVSVIWKGTEAMVKNDGSALNEEVFWEVFAENYGSEALKDKAVFDEFYEKEFQEVASDCGCNPKAKQTVSLIKEKGYRTVLATNPIFPRYDRRWPRCRR